MPMSQLLFGMLLVAIIVSIAVIDCRKMILPDRLNFLLATGGLGQAIILRQPTPLDASLGAALGLITLWGVAGTFRRFRGFDGLGRGDQKFAGAAGLWIGWQQMAPMLLIASCSALAFVALRSAKGRRLELGERMPFGPFLGIGTIVCWLVSAGTSL